MTWPPKVNEEKERVRRTSIIAVGAIVVTLLGLLDVAFTQEALTRGERVGAEKSCVACHALAGPDVSGKAGGSFDRWTGFDSPWIAVSTIWNHPFLMDIETPTQNRTWPQLIAAEMADIAAFLAHR